MAAKRIKKKTKNSPRNSNPRFWAAMGALAAYSATAGGKTVLAQKGPFARQVQSARSEALPVRRYQISDGTLQAVLDSFRKISGASVTVSDPALLGIQ